MPPSIWAGFDLADIELTGNGDFYVTGAVLTPGAVALPYAPEDPGITLLRCERQYENVLNPDHSGAVTALPVSLYWRNDTPSPGRFRAFVYIKFAVPKRRLPTLVYGGVFRVVGYGPGGTVTFSATADQVTREANGLFDAAVSLTGTGTIPAGTTYVQIDSSGRDGWIAFDASI
jgi:hypothetical protein